MMTKNESINHQPDIDLIHPYVKLFSTYYQIFIFVFGLIGNTITIIIFSRTKQTPRKTSFYLISLAVNDILCLITVFAKVSYKC